MFYVKENGMEIELSDENVYCTCPRCGKEQLVDLEEILKNGGDLFGTTVMCEDCTKIYKEIQHKSYRLAEETRDSIVDGVDMDAVETMLSQDIEDLVMQYWNEYLHREEDAEEGR